MVSLRLLLAVCDQCLQERGGHKQIGAIFPTQTQWPAFLSQWLQSKFLDPLAPC